MSARSRNDGGISTGGGAAAARSLYGDGPGSDTVSADFGDFDGDDDASNDLVRLPDPADDDDFMDLDAHVDLHAITGEVPLIARLRGRGVGRSSEVKMNGRVASDDEAAPVKRGNDSQAAVVEDEDESNPIDPGLRRRKVVRPDKSDSEKTGVLDKRAVRVPLRVGQKAGGFVVHSVASGVKRVAVETATRLGDPEADPSLTWVPPDFPQPPTIFQDIDAQLHERFATRHQQTVVGEVPGLNEFADSIQRDIAQSGVLRDRVAGVDDGSGVLRTAVEAAVYPKVHDELRRAHHRLQRVRVGVARGVLPRTVDAHREHSVRSEADRTRRDAIEGVVRDMIIPMTPRETRRILKKLYNTDARIEGDAVVAPAEFATRLDSILADNPRVLARVDTAGIVNSLDAEGNPAGPRGVFRSTVVASAKRIGHVLTVGPHHGSAPVDFEGNHSDPTLRVRMARVDNRVVGALAGMVETSRQAMLHEQQVSLDSKRVVVVGRTGQKGTEDGILVERALKLTAGANSDRAIGDLFRSTRVVSVPRAPIMGELPSPSRDGIVNGMSGSLELAPVRELE